MKSVSIQLVNIPRLATYYRCCDKIDEDVENFVWWELYDKIEDKIFYEVFNTLSFSYIQEYMTRGSNNEIS